MESLKLSHEIKSFSFWWRSGIENLNHPPQETGSIFLQEKKPATEQENGLREGARGRERQP